VSRGDRASSSLVLRLFGPPRIELDGEPVTIGRRKAVALLAYLAVTGQRHRRDTLVNLLWPDYDHTRGRAALRRTLFTLNKALAPGFLAVDRSEIGLASGALARVWVDVQVFHENLTGCDAHDDPPSEVCPDCLTPLTEAVALARGEFMAGFSLKDSINFDDWQVLQAEALKQDLGGALDRLARWHGGQRRFDAAVRYAKRRVALDPLDEAAHRQLMQLHVWSGKRSAALSQYDECVSVLQDQLGVPPQEATSELYRAIKAGRVLPPAPLERPPGEGVQPPAFLKGGGPYERPLFVAREKELARLSAFLDEAQEGRRPVVLVTGEAGSGKTSLIEEFSRRAQETDPQLLAAAGNCNAYTGIGDPYLPFREILELLTGDVEARWAAGAMSGEHARRLWNALPTGSQALVDAGTDLIDTFLPGGPLLERANACVQLAGGGDWAIRLKELVEGKTPAALSQSAQQSHLFEQYTRVLQALAKRGPLLLVVDDLQWADLGSISLFFHLGRHLRGSRILIVGAYRPEEIASGRVAEERERHPLAPVVNELQRDFGDIVVDVDRAKGREFVDAVLDSEPNRLRRPFREMLHRQTRGHPLFTIELLRGMQERGDLVRDDEGCWSEGPALDWDTLPARVEAAIAERIGRLAESSREVLRVASVEGEEFTAEVVASVLGISERETVSRLSTELDRRHRLVRARSIERVGTQRVSRYRFRNFLFQRFLQDRLDSVQRAYLHEDVGNALEGLYQDRAGELASIAPQLARHFGNAGITGKEIHYLSQAAKRSVQLSAWKEGIGHLTRALAILDHLPEPPASPASPEQSRAERTGSERARRELSLQLTLALAHIGLAGYVPEVEQALNRSRDLCQQLGRTAQLSRVVGELAVFHYVRAEYHEGLELAREALEMAHLAADPLLEALDHTFLGFILFTLGDYAAARSHLQQVIANYDPEEHHRGFVALRGADAGLTALAYEACCLWCLGYPDQAARRSQEASALARELGHPFSLADVLSYGVCLFNEMRRDPRHLMAGAEELLPLAREKVHGWLGNATWHWGEALALSGQLEEGIAQMRLGLELQRLGRELCHRTGCFAALAEAHRNAGRPEQGLEALAEALAALEAADERYLESELYRVQGELHLALGDEASAEAGYRQAIEVARRQSAKSWELRATTSLARLWQARGRRAEARQLLVEVYDWFTEGFETRDLREARELLDELA
jgi:adenylate cyclase